jgi:hypothetical protein
MKKSILKFLPVVGLLMVAFTACDEDGDGVATTAETEQRLANYFLDAEAVASNLYTIVDFSLKDSIDDGDTSMVLGAMVSRAADTYTIDYGTGVVGSDGLTRKGQIVATETGDYLATGGMVTTSFTNYSLDDKNIGGTISVENLGSENFEMIITNLDYNSEFTYNGTKDLQWVSGFNTLKDNTDDKFDISGNSSGSESGTGNALTANFTSPLKFDRSCQYTILEGVADLSLTGDSTITFPSVLANFVGGDGPNADGCNNQVIVTVSNSNGGSLTLPQIFNGF